ncbi:formate dehydrogenase accessory protein FdhE [Basfia succiniciproducens]|uniref:formate dehydrogenase accessory protein FdhE n=1 Tax=Basfia succiniciproducens TaxID=653940 RepID=UPI003FCDBD56
MSIRILPEHEIKKTATSFEQPALLFANPQNLYERRAKRLRKLSESHPFAEYLNFAAEVSEVQLKILKMHPLPQDERLTKENFSLDNSIQPLHTKNWKRDVIWREYLAEILAQIKLKATNQITTTIDWLEKASDAEIESLADKLLAEDFSSVSSDKAVFIWAALSLYWLQLAQQIPHTTNMESGENLHVCPVCNAAPVASVVHFGAAQGLRYLHCSLCESEWNMVRAKCSNCNQAEHLEYWSIDEEMAAVRSESCGDCHSYLKILFQEKDPHVEPVADDLATIYLDIEMEKKGFARSGLNPFMFPSEEA